VLSSLGIKLLEFDLALHLLLVLAREDDVAGGALELYKVVLGHRENLPEQPLLGNCLGLPATSLGLFTDLEVRCSVL